MTDHVRQIGDRLSLRAPQRESLALLDAVTELISLEKGADVAAALAAVRERFPQMEDFERAFPSFCFALATGVGKTRLMGAFVAYLHAAHDIWHFLVLAPNLTIYDKLIRDFTPGTEKYVLQGLGAFATNPPLVITGENYGDGAAIRHDVRHGQARMWGQDAVHINIFNIAKINAEVRGGSSPRIKRLRECLGQSYFDYLSGLPDLVLLMDESHRYRGTAGVKAINELAPVLGLELTATPQEQRGGRVERFRNVLYSYPLGTAMADGFVKEPAVATRADLATRQLTADELEELKLADGVTLHEHCKLELEAYARDTGARRVKPFLLVVARDTAHADAIAARLTSPGFRDGAYRDKVLTVHSNKSGSERDETVAQLLGVEQPDNAVEIVIHVDMLKEGWDVTNLYTIVPLRAGNSSTLVEQSIGRGLRLPYGQRTGVKAIDRLTIVAHDRFQEIVDAANDPDSVLGRHLSQVVIGRDVPEAGRKLVEIRPRFEEILRGGPADGREASPLFSTAEEIQVGMATMDVIASYGTRQIRLERLLDPDVKAEIMRQVRQRLPPQQQVLAGAPGGVDVEATVDRALKTFTEHTIAIPRISLQPVGEERHGYRDFDLDLTGFEPPLIDAHLLIQHLRTHDQELLAADGSVVSEPRPENHIVVKLMDLPEVDYEPNATLLYKLAGQVVAHLRARHPTDDALLRVLLTARSSIVSLIREQLNRHYVVHATRYEPIVSRGFEILRPQVAMVDASVQPRDIRQPVPDRAGIRGLLFGGVKRCLYPVQRFQSDPERRFAVLLEDAPEVLRWVKPKDGTLRISWSHDGRRDQHPYNPDFIVEAKDRRFLAEVKDAEEMSSAEVQAKARAAATWCGYATDHARSNDGKPWSYLLIPDSHISASSTFAGLVSQFGAPAAD